MYIPGREVQSLRTRIAQLEEELERHRWISVKERLPDEDQTFCEVFYPFSMHGDEETDMFVESMDGSKIKAGHDYTHWREIVLPGEEK